MMVAEGFLDGFDQADKVFSLSSLLNIFSKCVEFSEVLFLYQLR